MKYAPEQYARAFLSLMDGHPNEKAKITEGLVRTLAASGDLPRAEEVLTAIETALAKREGRPRISVRSARPLERSAIERIRSRFGADALTTTRVVPDLLGGVQIVVNEETMIDATLKRKLDALFGGAR